jgi:hypothetical protein
VILALDTATRTGWAAGAAGDRPTFGTRNFVCRGGNGEVLTLFRHWLEVRCDEFRPRMVVFESPYIPRPGAPMNALTLRRLFAMAVTVEAVCWERRIRCSETTALEIAKFFLGTGRHRREAKKAATLEMCRLHGFAVTDDNEADALALWCMAEAKINPAAGLARGVGPLFLQPENGAPRSRRTAGRGRLRAPGINDAQQPEQFIHPAS